MKAIVIAALLLPAWALAQPSMEVLETLATPPRLEQPAVPVTPAEPAPQRPAASVPDNVRVIPGEQVTIYEHQGEGGVVRTEVAPKNAPVYLFDDSGAPRSINQSSDPDKQEKQMWNLLKW
jgi:hypothetical protein